MSDETGRAFLEEARRHLSQDYLPKIERCLERLTDELIKLLSGGGLAFYDFTGGVPRAGWGGRM